MPSPVSASSPLPVTEDFMQPGDEAMIAVIADASFDIFGELQDPIGQAIAQKIDAAAFSGVEAPATWPTALIPGAVAAGNVVAHGSNTPDKGGVIGDFADLLSAVERDGYEPAAFGYVRPIHARCEEIAMPRSRSDGIERPAPRR
jgi:hypothetical protein